MLFHFVKCCRYRAFEIGGLDQSEQSFNVPRGLGDSDIGGLQLDVGRPPSFVLHRGQTRNFNLDSPKSFSLMPISHPSIPLLRQFRRGHVLDHYNYNHTCEQPFRTAGDLGPPISDFDEYGFWH